MLMKEDGVSQIVQPEVHTEEQRKLYENMARLMPFNPRAAMGI